MSFPPKDGEEDGERNNKVSKIHCETITDHGGVLVSPGFKKHPQTPPPKTTGSLKRLPEESLVR